MKLCRELGWNCAIRIACNTYTTLPDGASDRLDNWVPVNQPQPLFQNVFLTCETKLQNNVKGSLVIVEANCVEYHWCTRYTIYTGLPGVVGWNWHHAQRIDRRLLALSIAAFWCHELGEFVLQQGEPARCLVDPTHKRTLSLFQLGLRWLDVSPA